MSTYRTRGSCSREIIFHVDENNILLDVKFLNGCSGNLQAIARLVKGKHIDDIIEVFKGIRCRNGTSCPDQLAQALIAYKENATVEPDNDEEELDETEEIF